MRTYETIYIVHPDVAGDEYTAVVGKFREVLTTQGAEVLHVEEWGNRKLAYPIKKQGRGSYVLMAYEAPAEAISEFERRLRIDEQIMKFQTVLLEKGFVAPAAAESPAETAASEESEKEESEVTQEPEAE